MKTLHPGKRYHQEKGQNLLIMKTPKGPDFIKYFYYKYYVPGENKSFVNQPWIRTVLLHLPQFLIRRKNYLKKSSHPLSGRESVQTPKLLISIILPVVMKLNMLHGEKIS